MPVVCVDITDSFTHLFGHRISYPRNGFTFFKTLVNLNCNCKLRVPKTNRIFWGQLKKYFQKVIFNFCLFLSYDMSFLPNTLFYPCYLDFFLGLHLENNLKGPHSQSNFLEKKDSFPPKLLFYSKWLHLVMCRILWFGSLLRKRPWFSFFSFFFSVNSKRLHMLLYRYHPEMWKMEFRGTSQDCSWCLFIS